MFGDICLGFEKRVLRFGQRFFKGLGEGFNVWEWVVGFMYRVERFLEWVQCFPREF